MPDTDLRDYVLEGLCNGFHLKSNPSRLSSARRNMPSAYQHKEVIDKYLQTEINRGSIAGPFLSKPFDQFQISRFGVIPKSTEGEWRLILDLSYPKGASVNDGISDSDAHVQYLNLDTVIEKIVEGGRGTLLSKFDVAHAYRNVPINEEDRPLLGMQWRGKFYVDLTLSFGGRSAPRIFSSVAEVLRFILCQVTKFSSLMNYLDDFLNITPRYGIHSRQVAGRASSDFGMVLATCQDLGVPVAHRKTVGPTTLLEFLGIVLDTERFEARLSPKKVHELLQLLSAWIRKKHGTKRELLSVIGKLTYCCQVVEPGRPFLRRLINRAYSVNFLHYQVHLNALEREDLRWWNTLLSDWNGVSLFRWLDWDTPVDFEVGSDAAKSRGLGIIFQQEWVSMASPEHDTENMNIAVLELIPVVIAAQIWGAHWARKRLLFKIDNMAVVQSINSGLPKDTHLAFLVRHLALLSVKFNFSYKAAHVPGKFNIAADALSRFDYRTFRNAMPEAAESPTTVPVELLHRLFFQHPVISL